MVVREIDIMSEEEREEMYGMKYYGDQGFSRANR